MAKKNKSSKSKTLQAQALSPSKEKNPPPSPLKTKPKVSHLIITNSPLYEFLAPFKRVQNQWMVKYIVILFALIIRTVVSFGSYSGQGDAPRFGDFEAQRHWLDLTVNLPISKWYYYNLEHWGLDYPPLTAYHSLLLGYIGRFFRPEWFLLDETNGLEHPDLKFFMRITVIVSESLLYIPTVYYFTKWFTRHVSVLEKKSLLDLVLSLAVILFQPSLILIDHGHFQYNSVMLGLMLASVDFLLSGHRVLASVFFVLCLCFKQMALFYAPLIFAYLLGTTFNPFNKLLGRKNIYDFNGLFWIGTATLVTFFTMFFPLYFFAENGVDNLIQSIVRIFPFNRGIFEDKVANFWCATNTFFKYKNLPLDLLKLSALSFTVVSILPSCVVIYLHPIKLLLPWALALCSWGFFLFSFQVHEKSVLLPLLPTNLLFCYVNDNQLFKMLSWINNAALFSMGPLLKRDKLDLQYYALVFLSNWLVGNLSITSLVGNVKGLFKDFFTVAWFQNWIIFGSTVVATALDILPYFVAPPPNLPDLWVVLNVMVSFACFASFYIWITWKTVTLVK